LTFLHQLHVHALSQDLSANTRQTTTSNSFRVRFCLSQHGLKSLLVRDSLMMHCSPALPFSPSLGALSLFLNGAILGCSMSEPTARLVYLTTAILDEHSERASIPSLFSEHNCTQTASVLNSTSCPVVCHPIGHSTHNIWSQVSSSFPALYIIFTCLCTSASGLSAILLCRFFLRRFVGPIFFSAAYHSYVRNTCYMISKHLSTSLPLFLQLEFIICAYRGMPCVSLCYSAGNNLTK
jgi:hypothetical protein